MSTRRTKGGVQVPLLDWTDQQIEQLRVLWGQGMSAAQVAVTFGPNVSRSAILGKVSRLHLHRKDTQPLEARLRVIRNARHAANTRWNNGFALLRPRPQPRPRVPVVHGKLARPPKAPPSRPKPRPCEEMPSVELRCSLVELNRTRCRWPIGDPQESDFCFCGSQPAGELPYCGYHAHMAYQPPRERDPRSARR